MSTEVKKPKKTSVISIMSDVQTVLTVEGYVLHESKRVSGKSGMKFRYDFKKEKKAPAKKKEEAKK